MSCSWQSGQHFRSKSPAPPTLLSGTGAREPAILSCPALHVKEHFFCFKAVCLRFCALRALHRHSPTSLCIGRRLASPGKTGPLCNFLSCDPQPFFEDTLSIVDFPEKTRGEKGLFGGGNSPDYRRNNGGLLGLLGLLARVLPVLQFVQSLFSCGYIRAGFEET